MFPANVEQANPLLLRCLYRNAGERRFSALLSGDGKAAGFVPHQERVRDPATAPGVLTVIGR
jgi:hypothetical protein